ncbi:transporter substrate-binding domain-containing protein [Pelomonas sp. SE-A7]|uniref:substrate-binding periplasmic protein n=1 Tax=Pelomonas sp. SE-A7 TaxID=3054953 RepID=UPI00259CC20C|nr:transporter substrate-binding domain-containing protein [Pelomonas sp. SE-A7]MDM4767006.1 transporter substrate-binding domain-containing protein [Pelomonas sp. SE-A7]
MPLASLLRAGLALLSCSLLLLPPCRADTALRIATWDRGSDPLTAVSEAVLQRAYQEAGQKLEWVELPNRRALQALLGGEVDGNLHRVKALADSQPKLVRVETPIGSSAVRAYTMRADMELDGWARLQGLRVAYQRGILRVEQLLPAGAIRVEASSSSELFRLLASGGADVALSTEPGQAPPLRRSTGLRRLDMVLDEHALYHYLDARHAELAKRLAVALRKLQASGELDQVRRHALHAHLQQAGMASD